MKAEKCFPPPAFDFCRGKWLILWIVVKASITVRFSHLPSYIENYILRAWC